MPRSAVRTPSTTAVASTPPLDDQRSHWLTPIEAALYLRVAIGTLRNWTSARYVPFTKRGRIVRYDRRALDRWLSRGACAGRSTLADI